MVDTVALSMSRAAVEAQVGALDCHDTTDGVHVCRPRQVAAGSKPLDIFFFHNVVVSIAHEIPPPAEVWSHLERLIHQYGAPSLNGMTQRDGGGRLHEIYGWRDTRSLYSVRFVWEEMPQRRVVGAVLTLWDRAAYSEWEQQRPQQTSPKEPA
jgi:hypothetical protein